MLYDWSHIAESSANNFTEKRLTFENVSNKANAVR